MADRPIERQYAYNSTYAFSEDKVTGAIELEGLEILPINSAWFRINATQNPNQTWSQNVSVVSANVPAAFKDETGSPLFSAGSVDIGVNGYTGNQKGTYFKPGNNLPPNPEWSLGGETPIAPNSVAGGKIGLDLESNRAFADKADAIGEAPQLISNLITTFTHDKPIWDAYTDLHKNQYSFDKAVKAVGNLGMSMVEMNPNPTFKNQVINFVNDGSLPSAFDAQANIKIINTGIDIMKAYNIKVQNETLSQQQMYQQILDYFKKKILRHRVLILF